MVFIFCNIGRYRCYKKYVINEKFLQKKDFPINKIKSKEIYYCLDKRLDKRNKNKINSMLVIKKRKKINKLKKRIMIYKDLNNILNSDIYIIQYNNIKKTLYKVDIKKNIIKLKKKYICKLKVVKKYILLKKYSCRL